MFFINNFLGTWTKGMPDNIIGFYGSLLCKLFEGAGARIYISGAKFKNFCKDIYTIYNFSKILGEP